MININSTLIAGGFYIGGEKWNKKTTSLDKCFKIYHLKHGEAYLFSENEKYKLEAGNVYFINGFRIVEQYCPLSFQVNWLHFLSESIFLKQALSDFPVVTKLTSNFLSQSDTDFELFQSFFSNYSAREKMENKEVLVNYFTIQSLILKVLGTLAELSDWERFYLSGQGSRLFKAIEFINANYKKPVTLKELSDLCYMSENYFHSLFKKEFTVTPNNYILQLRMNEALNLLSNTGMSIKEVAQEVGYPDPAYFSRIFSKYFSLSPNKYKSLHSIRIP